MFIPTWVLWVFASILACMPLCILLMSKGEKGGGRRPKSRWVQDTDSVVEVVPLGVEEYLTEDELNELCMFVAHVQMRQMWGKDIDHIV